MGSNSGLAVIAGFNKLLVSLCFVFVLCSCADGVNEISQNEVSQEQQAIKPQNDAPTLNIPIADQSAQQNNAFRFQIPADTFLDSDPLSYSVTLVDGSPQGGPLPEWLSFDALTRTFSGTPQFNDITGPNGITIQVTADDNNEGTVSDEFNLIVVETNHPPTDIFLTNNTVGENVANGTVVGVLTAMDTDANDNHTYTIDSDSSNGGFGIQGNQLVVADSNRLDFEVSSIHSVFLQVADRFNVSLAQPKEFTITLIDQNDPPIIVLPQPVTVVENTTAVITLQGTDQDGDPISFGLAGGVDAALFDLSSSGELSFTSAPNFEAPGDTDGNNAYEVIVSISDGVVASVVTPITVEVSDTPEPPMITSSPIVNATQSQLYQYDVVAADDDLVNGDSLTFSLTVSPPSMSIDPDTGLISWIPSNAEVAGSPHHVNVHVQDTSGFFDDQPFQISVVEFNERPTGLQLDSAVIGENVSPGTAVGRFTVTDPDNGDSHTLTIANDPSNAFGIGGANNDELIVTAPDNLDFETNPTVIIEVQANDTGGLGLNPTPSFSITIQNQNDPPELIPQAFTVVENAIAAQPGNIVFSDEDTGDTVTVTISGGPDAGQFSLVADTGELTFQAAPNFETPSDTNQDNIYLIDVSANDGITTTVSRMTITVTDANDRPAPVDDTYTVGEGGTITIPDLVRQPPYNDLLNNDLDEDGDPLSISLLTSPTNATAFTFNTDGSFTYTHDGSETSSDSFTYQVDDNTGEPNATASATVTINVLAQNDPPVIVDPPPEGQVNVSMAEDGYSVILDQPKPFVLTLNANDAENNLLSWSISGNPGNGAANVIGNDTSAVINYTPDADYHGQDQFDVLVDDQSGGTDTIQVIVDISPQNDTPVLPSLVVQTHTEGETITPLNAAATDVDGDTLVYSAAGLPPGLTIDTATGQISGTITIDAVGNYPNIIVYANDQSGMSNAQGQSTPFSWSVLVNQNPIAVIDQPVDATTVDINANITLEAGGSYDPDNHIPLEYQWDISGPSNFSATGVNAAVSFPNAGVHTVALTVTDSLGKQAQQSIQINVNTPPTGVSLSPSTVPENSPTNSIVGTLTAIDPDSGDTHTFAMANGGDAGGRFKMINGNQVAVADGSLLNFEAANSHDITVEVRDRGGLGAPVSQILTIILSDVNDAPVVVNPGPLRNTEGDSVSLAISASDEDSGDILKFSASLLPPGLSISPTGVISGTIAVGASVSSYDAQVTVDDQQGKANSSTPIAFTWTVDPLPLTGLFADSNLETCILGYGWSYAHEVNGTVVCEGLNVSDLDGMQYLVNLNRLELRNNQITDISPLRGLNDLRALMLDNNLIAGLSGYSEADFKGLQQLSLVGNPVLDVTGLQNLMNLTDLDLSGLSVSISGVSQIAGLTAEGFGKLQTLKLQNNALTDLSGLENRNTLRELWLSGNAITDINNLSSLANLTVLELGNNAIVDAGALQSLTNLTRLVLNKNRIGETATGNLDTLASLVNVQNLDLTGNTSMSCRQLQTLIDTFGATPVGAVSPGAPSIGVNCTEPLSTLFSATNADLQACMDQAAASNGWLLANDVTGTFTCDNMSNGDLTGLEYLVNLTGFQANNSNITDADSATLAQLPNLTSLSLQNNNINDLSFLTVLTGLTALWLENNNVTDISALQNTSLLQTLSLANNVGISDFSALNSLDLLTDLNLENTSIGDLSVLINKPLVTLNLNSNQLQDLTLLGTLISLQTLQLANNQITDVNPLTGLVNLITLDLQNNQIGDGVQGYVDQLSALTSAISIDLTNNLTMSCGELKMLLNSPISANVTPSTVVSNPINPNVNCTELPADFSTTTVVISPLNPETHRYVYMTVNAKDIYGNNKTRGGDTVVVTALAGGVNFANDVGFIVTNNGDGTYSAKYAPYYYGDDNFYITINNDAVNGDNKNGQYTVHANDPPGVGIGIFGPSETIAVGDTINMTANGSDAEDPNNLTYYWDFGGPGNGIYDSNNNEIQFSTAKDPGYLTYTKTGTFPVTVTVTDPNGSTDSDSKKIVVANTWGTPEQLSTGSASSNPNIAIDGAGNMIAVWSERTQQFTTSIFAKRFQPVTGWDAPVVVEDVLANSYSNQPKIAMASSGYTIVVWKRLDGVSSIGRLWSNRYDPLDPINSWGIAQQVEQGVDNVLTLDMAQNNLGDAVVVWGERGATEDFIGARHYDRGTETWIGAPTPLATTATGHTFNWPRVTISPDSNEAYALWGDKASIGDIFGSASLAAGVWGPLQLLENDAGDAANPQISTLSNGNRFAVWSQVINYRSTIFSSEYSAGSWSTPQQVETNTAAGAAVEPHIAVDNSDNVIAIWRQGGHLWSALHDLNTSNWSLPQIISNQDVGQVGGDAVTYDNKVLAVNSSGDAIAVFYDGGDLWANNFNNGSGWGEPRLLESIPSGEFTIANQPALVIDSAGVGTVVWYQSVDIWVSRLQ